MKNLSIEFKTKHEQIPGKLIAGMRDKVIHAYNDVDLDEVWWMSLILNLGTTGFEPATYCSQSNRATKLRYVPFPKYQIN
mgnify:CR=1 FL=1